MKGDLIYINPDKIDYIRIVGPKEKKLFWFEETKLTAFFGLYHYATVEAGWGENIGDYDYKYRRWSTNYLINDKNYIFEKEHVSGKQWYKQPYIYIVLGKNYIKEFYPTLEEAELVVQQIINKAKTNFQVLKELT